MGVTMRCVSHSTGDVYLGHTLLLFMPCIILCVCVCVCVGIGGHWGNVCKPVQGITRTVSHHTCSSLVSV